MEDTGSAENQSAGTTESTNNNEGTSLHAALSGTSSTSGATESANTQNQSPSMAGVGGDEPDSAQAAAQAIAAYQPNLKFKYLDVETNKQLEKDMDEWIKPLLKDADTEAKVRQLYAKAYGMDHAKSSREKFKAENETLRQEKTQFDRSLQILSQHVQNDDMESFFEALKIPEDKVLKYALNRVQYRDLPPEKRAEYDQMRSTKQRAALLEQENARLSEQYTSVQAQTRAHELDSYVSNPNVAGVAEQFDARVGQGAFRNEVIKRGQYYWAIHQQDIPVQQAVNEVLQMIGHSMQPNTAQVPGSVPTQTAPSGVPGVSQTPDKKPVLPNIQGRGTSPARKLPNSIKDLKKLAMEASS